MIYPRFLTKHTIKQLQRGSAILAVLAILFGMTPVQPARAATLTTIKDTLTTIKAATAADHTVTFATPTGIIAGGTFSITFTGFTMGSVAITDVEFVGKTIAASCSAGTWGYVLASTTMTFTSCTGTVSALATVTVKVGLIANSSTGANQITNPSIGSYKIAIAGTMADSGSTSVSIITNDVVNVTSTVDPSFTFTVDDNAIGFGTLVTSGPRYATANAAGAGTDSTYANRLGLASNTTAGYTVTYNGTAFTNGSNPYSNTALTSDADGNFGTAQEFGLSVTTTGSGTIASGYNHSGPDWKFTSGSAQTLLTWTGAIASTDNLDVRYLANISATTAPGTYQSNITYVGTATF